ncbi:putative transmembrane protein, partial [Toxoplasma gondii MAS]
RCSTEVSQRQRTRLSSLSFTRSGFAAFYPQKDTRTAARKGGIFVGENGKRVKRFAVFVANVEAAPASLDISTTWKKVAREKLATVLNAATEETRESFFRRLSKGFSRSFFTAASVSLAVAAKPFQSPSARLLLFFSSLRTRSSLPVVSCVCFCPILCSSLGSSFSTCSLLSLFLFLWLPSLPVFSACLLSLFLLAVRRSSSRRFFSSLLLPSFVLFCVCSSRLIFSFCFFLTFFSFSFPLCIPSLLPLRCYLLPTLSSSVVLPVRRPLCEAVASVEAARNPWTSSSCIWTHVDSGRMREEEKAGKPCGARRALHVRSTISPQATRPALSFCLKLCSSFLAASLIGTRP